MLYFFTTKMIKQIITNSLDSDKAMGGENIEYLVVQRVRFDAGFTNFLVLIRSPEFGPC